MSVSTQGFVAILGCTLVIMAASAKADDQQRGVLVDQSIASKACLGRDKAEKYAQAAFECQAALTPDFDEEVPEETFEPVEPFNFLDFLVGFSAEKLCVANKLGWLDEEGDTLDLQSLKGFFLSTPMNSSVDFNRALDFCQAQVESSNVLAYLHNLHNLGLIELEEDLGETYINADGWINVNEAIASLDDASLTLATRISREMDFLQCMSLCDQVACQLYVTAIVETGTEA
ncbi:hypothetical protein TCAL_00549 [Tigriopus californicus]|uniref:Uncharacterized protein n=1 Tax=Tigriopus californicus TaxID=6832 RepID=A0A553PCS6_TIGCA|nr:uncharacterized protein LOC131893256 [Tigriopus californicus]TRY75497.1 hypothetical protein TCAL_00549 [Tigriopus californicus]|eukprot:TCALIF_00549-PA protein Name:"Protein of unknown function" AED:0.00 eAED:0.00 QI:110/1/1/1/1/1/3/106/230